MIQNTTLKTNDQATRTLQKKPGVSAAAPEGYTVLLYI